MGTRIVCMALCMALCLPPGHASEPQANQPGPAPSAVAAVAATPVEVASHLSPLAPLTPSDRDAVQPLSPQEEADLAMRAEKPGPDVAGGALSNEHLTYAVIALGAIALVLILK